MGQYSPIERAERQRSQREREASPPSLAARLLRHARWKEDRHVNYREVKSQIAWLKRTTDGRTKAKRVGIGMEMGRRRRRHRRRRRVCGEGNEGCGTRG